MSAAKCRDCGERVVCEALRCGPCWKAHALRLEERLAELERVLRSLLPPDLGGPPVVMNSVSRTSF